MLSSAAPLLLLAASAQIASASAFYWPNVKHVFSFGDSYTDTYSRFVNGTLTASQDYRVRRSPFAFHWSRVDRICQSTSGGKMWIEWLTDTYNVTTVELYNFACVYTGGFKCAGHSHQ